MTVKKGFTLIELLVVIAIIGLLSAVILAALNTARNQSRDASIQQQMKELAKVMELSHLEYKSYNTLAPGDRTFSATNGCSPATGGFGGSFAEKAIELCESIHNVQRAAGVAPYIRVRTFATGTKYGISVRKASVSNEFFCVGSGGGTYEGLADPDGTGPLASWEAPGCPLNTQ